MSFSKNLLAVCFDGESTNIGENNSLFSRLNEFNENIFTIIDLAHSVNLVVKNNYKYFSDIIVRILKESYSYFKSSPKKKAEFLSLAVFKKHLTDESRI